MDDKSVLNDFQELGKEVIKKLKCSGIPMQDYKCLRHGIVQPSCADYKLCCKVIQFKEEAQCQTSSNI